MLVYILIEGCLLRTHLEIIIVTSLTQFDKKLPEQSLYKNPKTGITTSYRMRKYSGAAEHDPIVFLHGFNGNSRSWAFQFDFFTDRTVIAINAPGFGRSDVIEGGMSVIADEVAATITALVTTPVVIVGHSMGGMLAQVLAVSHSDVIRALVLSCTHTGNANAADVPLNAAVQQRLEQRSKMDDATYGSLRVSAMLPGIAENEMFAFLADIAGEITYEGIRCGGLAMHHLDTRPLLPRIALPTYIIKAANDTVVSAEKGAALEHGISSATISVLQNVGHAPYCEDPEAFNIAISSFLASLSGPGDLS